MNCAARQRQRRLAWALGADHFKLRRHEKVTCRRAASEFVHFTKHVGKSHLILAVVPEQPLVIILAGQHDGLNSKDVFWRLSQCRV